MRWSSIPLLDFEPIVAETCTASVERVAAFPARGRAAAAHDPETHAHADHLSGAQYLKSQFGAGVAIGAGICAVQQIFAGVYRLGPDFATDGRQFDRLLHDGEEVTAGSLRFQVLSTPGHTPAVLRIASATACFVGDALFIEDYGTGRCDFPAATPIACIRRSTSGSTPAWGNPVSSSVTTISPAVAPCALGPPSPPSAPATSTSTPAHRAKVCRLSPHPRCHAQPAAPPAPERAGQHQRRSPAQAARKMACAISSCRSTRDARPTTMARRCTATADAPQSLTSPPPR